MLRRQRKQSIGQGYVGSRPKGQQSTGWGTGGGQPLPLSRDGTLLCRLPYLLGRWRLADEGSRSRKRRCPQRAQNRTQRVAPAPPRASREQLFHAGFDGALQTSSHQGRESSGVLIRPNVPQNAASLPESNALCSQEEAERLPAQRAGPPGAHVRV